ncbi:poly-gamma-glutamate synthesis protein (capsule biosynthesis protein) [Yoonia maricola]|uniref:Poly-gamma-glutamate synthesis protein (Capsule biosynthesis protein) n=1 Tax=Yoonia maricola TaxID=420999 RepID=A0A2M8W2J7_9RHOB|nr:CapA family protein [Yoonia maricola]PJI85144.1 poly-gamma-glutamate synthesis protein (capsule biosynthesis protein) [Yoonia maricola]
MSLLPITPFETLRVSNPVLKGIMVVVMKVADMFGFWKVPRKGAASDLPEMGLLDNLYWVYKSQNLVSLPESGLDTSAFMDSTHVQLAPDATDGSKLTISFAGDILRTHRAEPVKNEIYGSIEDLLFDADLSIANYESPVTTQPLVDEVIGDAGPPTECASEVHFEALTSHKGKFIDVLNVANNHIFDMGAEGVKTTLAALAKRNITPLGIFDDPSQQTTAKTVEKNGIKLGFASCTFGTNGHPPPDDTPHSVNIAKLTSKHAAPDLALLKAQISHAKDAGCDLVVAVLHWGHEFELFPRRAQQLAAQELADFGADIIVCHHPHVAQPIELYRTKSGDRTVPIAYSLGSLLWGFAHEKIASSTILQVDVQKTNGKTAISSFTATPVRWHAEKRGDTVAQRVTRVNV